LRILTAHLTCRPVDLTQNVKTDINYTTDTLKMFVNTGRLTITALHKWNFFHKIEHVLNCEIEFRKLTVEIFLQKILVYINFEINFQCEKGLSVCGRLFKRCICVFLSISVICACLTLAQEPCLSSIRRDHDELDKKIKKLQQQRHQCVSDKKMSQACTNSTLLYLDIQLWMLFNNHGRFIGMVLESWCKMSSASGVW